MKHLSVEEMIDFVSFDKLNSESLEFAAKINAHIFNCDECRKKIEAFQTLDDQFEKMENKKELEDMVKEKLRSYNDNSVDRHIENNAENDLDSEIKRELDNYL